MRERRENVDRERERERERETKNYLRFGDVEQFGHFRAFGTAEVLFELELPLQFKDLSAGEGRPGFFLLPVVAQRPCDKKRRRERSDEIGIRIHDKN